MLTPCFLPASPVPLQVLESCRLRTWVAKQWALSQKSVSPTLSPSGGSDNILSRNPTSTPLTTVPPAAAPMSPPPAPHSPPTLRSTVSVTAPGGGSSAPLAPSGASSFVDGVVEGAADTGASSGEGAAAAASAAAAAASAAAALATANAAAASANSQLVAAKAQIENAKKDNRLYLRIVNEKQAKILQLENALTTLQRDVIVRGFSGGGSCSSSS